MKNKKGFTLIELIGVILILCMIMLLVVPSVLGLLQKSKVSLNNRQLDMILDAAKKWGVSNYYSLSDTDPVFIKINELASGGFIESAEIADLTNPAKKFNGCVMSMFSYKRQTYEYKYLEDCDEEFYKNKVSITSNYTSGWVKKVDVEVTTEFKATDGDTHFKYCSSNSPTCTPNKEVHKNKGTVSITTQGNSVYACAVSVADTGSVSELKCTGPFKIDNSAPVLTIPEDENLDSLVTTYDFNRGVSATDTYTPADKISITKTGNISLGTLGEYTLSYTATDLAGNSTTKSRKVTVVDVTPPTLELTVSSSQFNSNGWAKENISVGVNTQDRGGSGVAYYMYCKGTSNNCTPNQKVTNLEEKVTLTSESKTNYACAYAVDGANNIGSTVCTGPYKLDKHAPELDYDNPITIGTSIKTYGLETDVKFKDNLTSAGELDIVSTGNVSFGVSGTYDVTHTVTDLAGNTTTETRQLIIVDDEKPEIQFSIEGTPFNDKGWATAKFNINVTTSDEGDGVSSYTYCTGTSKCTPSITETKTSGKIEIDTASATNWICGYAKDLANNDGDVVCVGPYKLDKKAPDITTPGDTTVTLGDSTFKLMNGVSATDDVSSDDSITITPSGAFDVDNAGVYTITYTATDLAGRTSTATRTITVNKKVTLSFNKNNASSISATSASCTITNGTTCNLTVPTITAPTNTPTVVGWNKSSTGTTSTVNSGGTLTVNASQDGATYYAITKKNAVTFTANFAANGATLGSTTASCTINATYNNTAQASSCTVTAPTITRSGWEIIGYNTSSSAHESTLANGGTITLNSDNNNVKYYAITKYSFTLTGSFVNNINKAIAASTSTKTCTATRYNTVSTASCNITAPTIDGGTYYNVVGWNTNESATTSSLASGGSTTLSGSSAGTTTYYTIVTYKTGYVKLDATAKCYTNYMYIRDAYGNAIGNGGHFSGDTLVIKGEDETRYYYIGQQYRPFIPDGSAYCSSRTGSVTGYANKVFITFDYFAPNCGC